MRRFSMPAVLLVALAAMPAAAQQPAPARVAPDLHVANLRPLNTQVTDGMVRGLATLLQDGGELWIQVDARGLAPGMHLQHLHGYTDGRVASCPGPDADRNADGVVDLIETREAAGITMIPLHENPSSLEIQAATYPRADSLTGMIRYAEIEQLEPLQQAVRQQYDGTELFLDRRVIFIHGVPEGTQLPATAQSLEGVPAHVTLPVACGEVVRVVGRGGG